MSKYEFLVNIEGTIVIEADSEEEARDMVEDGYPIQDINVTNVEEEFLREVKA